jgi:hypothetical protein
MYLTRSVEAEWLDQLPAGDRRAVRSRRDLRRINTVMRNHKLVERELQRVFSGKLPETIAEIGAGDGSFMLRVAETLGPRWRPMGIVLVDRLDVVNAATTGAYSRIGWTAQATVADVFAWLAQPAAPVFDVMVANLFLHHFDAARLRTLLQLISQRTNVLIACEPRRSLRALLGSHLLGALGCNDVSRHDAVASVRAGFTHRELSGAWPQGEAWHLREQSGGMFGHCFIASRSGGTGGGRP